MAQHAPDPCRRMLLPLIVRSGYSPVNQYTCILYYLHDSKDTTTAIACTNTDKSMLPQYNIVRTSQISPLKPHRMSNNILKKNQEFLRKWLPQQNGYCRA